MDLVTDRPIAL